MPILTFDQDKAAEIIVLFTQAQAGDDVSLNKFLDRLQPKLVHYFEAYGFVGDADDLAQTALMSLTRAIPRISPATVVGYVARVAQRLAYKAARREHEITSRYTSLSEANEVPVMTGTEAYMDEVEVRETVIRVCQTILTPEQRLVVLESLAGYTPSTQSPIY